MPKLNHNEWLAERKKSIGGSDAAAIVGLSAYCSPYTVWAEKTGRLPPREDNEAMRQGRDLEEYVAQRFCEATGKRVRRKTDMIRNQKHPFAHANIDRLVIGEKAGLECKTTSALNTKLFKNGEYPAHYYVQCVHYMMVTGLKKWYLAVLVLNKEFHIFEIERDEEEIEALAAAEAEFWKSVESDTPPPVDGTNSTTDTIKTIFREETPGTFVSLVGCEPRLRELSRLKDSKKTLEGLIAAEENYIKDAMGDAEAGECDGFKVLWRTVTRQAHVVKESSSRSFRVSFTE